MKTSHQSGTRKRSVARATIREGTGKIKINGRFLDYYQPIICRERIREPIILAGDVAGKIDIDVVSNGGGVTGQADAIRLAIARALVDYTKSDRLKQTYLDYDRLLLVADVRRKEMRKPNDSKARAKRQKSYR